MAPEDQDVTLKEFFVRELSSLKELITVKLDSIDKATSLAYTNMNERFNRVAEYQNQLQQQSAQFYTRRMHDEYAEKVNNQIDMFCNGYSKELKALQLNDAELKGKASQKSVSITLAISIMGLIVALIGIVTKIFA